MNEKEIYDFLQDLLPKEIRYINPYIDEGTIPNGSFVQMAVVNIKDSGVFDERQIGFNEENDKIIMEYDQNRIYVVQFDSYGIDAFDNISRIKAILNVNLWYKKNPLLDLGYASNIDNLTWLQPNQEYIQRWSFRIELISVFTIRQEHEYFEDIKVKNVYISDK
ncbi:MAG: LIC_12616 family protein [Alphaproteobacteria bacterium]